MERPQKDEGNGLAQPGIGEESPYFPVMVVNRWIRIGLMLRILVVSRGLGLVMMVVVMIMIVVSHMKHRFHIF